MASITKKQADTPQVDRRVEWRISKTVVTPAANPRRASAGIMARETPINGAMPSPPLNPVNTDFQ
jgi:hypothetical protein